MLSLGEHDIGATRVEGNLILHVRQYCNAIVQAFILSRIETSSHVPRTVSSHGNSPCDNGSLNAIISLSDRQRSNMILQVKICNLLNSLYTGVFSNSHLSPITRIEPPTITKRPGLKLPW
ncbi:hypothetical protein D3C75_570130 [compost metagenome]